MDEQKKDVDAQKKLTPEQMADQAATLKKNDPAKPTK